jgi:hypothetical protein
MSLEFIPSLEASESVEVNGNVLRVSCSGYAIVSLPIALEAGPMAASFTVEKAIELGNALIRMAHHHTAAMAEYRAAQNDQAAQS